MTLDGQIVQQYSYDWCQKAFQHSCLENGFQVCGVTDYPDKLGVKLDAEIGHSSQEILIEIRTNFKEGECLDASWALETMEVEVK